MHAVYMFLHTKRKRASSLGAFSLSSFVMLLLSRPGMAFLPCAHHQYSSVLSRGLLRAGRPTTTTIHKWIITPQVASHASMSILYMAWDENADQHDARGGAYSGSGRRQDVDRGFSNPRSAADRRHFGGGARSKTGRYRNEDDDMRMRRARDLGDGDHGNARQAWGGGDGGNPRQGWAANYGRGSSGGGRGGGYTGRGGGRGGQNRSTQFKEEAHVSGPMKWLEAEQQDRARRGYGGGGGGDGGWTREIGNSNGSYSDRPTGRGRGRGGRGREGSRSSTGGRRARSYDDSSPRDSRGGAGRERTGLDDVLQQYRKGELGVRVDAGGEDTGYEDMGGGGGGAESAASDWIKGQLCELLSS